MNGLDLYKLTDRHALVCGSTQGIGRACAVQFAALGARVTLLARDESALKRTAEQLPRDGGQDHGWLRADFDDPAALERTIRPFLEHNPVHVLLNNSGGPPHGSILEATPDDFLKAYRRLLICNQLLCRAVLPGMKAARYGRIINIISTSVKEPIPGLGVSNTTRWAVAAWAKTWAGEVAPLGVTVNNVLPGYTNTARLAELIESKARAAGSKPEAVQNEIVARIPMGRLGTPEEIAAAAAFLASPAASYVTGINLTVDGGRTSTL